MENVYFLHLLSSSASICLVFTCLVLSGVGLCSFVLRSARAPFLTQKLVADCGTLCPLAALVGGLLGWLVACWVAWWVAWWVGVGWLVGWRVGVSGLVGCWVGWVGGLVG